MRDGSATVYIAVRYAECFSRPVKVHPAGCGCDETGCEYSRVRDSYEIKVLWQLPDSHVRARADDQAWCDTVKNTSPELLKRRHTFPVPPCPECDSDPWVVLATVSFSVNPNAVNANMSPVVVRFTDRRVLLASQRLQVATLCLP